ncbi:2-oxo acid dehydrogenase subunit E2 [Halieaceae bacterium IMCC14734]|uniref:Dihydrolipoamide acetyltransferase component of pyruvate dehydrogenase complex n=1 Tax=Candidatus Litorirhabdus singularis TaxID=2518993 RepID=A0ABT3TEA0_9GAMM|nr:dihydrolipoamide acetyltransferase family protein [Candidatus Litorirhabdus singularis]MCX2980150.1 2-oxo acid dehydrogenase subunit E2 [Candidatus Litorirhabdus singularis]
MSEIYAIAVPKWGIEMVEGTISTWNKSVGDAVRKGEDVFEMESDKIVNVWDAPVDGVLRRRLVEEGETMPVGSLLGIIAAADVDDAAIDAFIADFAGPAADAPAAAKPAAAGASAPMSEAAKKVNPVVRRLAAELNVDLDSVTGTGRNGRITKEDVELAASAGAPDDVSDDYEIIPLSPIRKTIGKRLTQAKQDIPHFYLTIEYELDGLMAHRQKLKEAGDKVSVNDLLVYCVAQALMAEPRVNVNLVGDNIHQFKHANVAVAIATDDGLFPATVYNADTLSAQEISAATAVLAEKARGGKLEKADISNGSFTVSNLGMFGVSTFNAIINPPMGAILALGKGEARVAVKDGVPAVATMINATLSCDHRVIDGAVGAGFLAALGEEIAKLGA